MYDCINSLNNMHLIIYQFYLLSFDIWPPQTLSLNLSFPLNKQTLIETKGNILVKKRSYHLTSKIDEL